MRKVKSVLDLILGNREKVESERYFMTITCLSASVFLVILCVFHLLMSLKVAPVFIAGGSSMLLLGMYLIVRFTEQIFLPKLLVTVNKI